MEQEKICATGPTTQAKGVFIVPELDLVVVMNAGLYKSPAQSLVPIRALNQYVLKAVSRRSP
jgi:hypothetical protein